MPGSAGRFGADARGVGVTRLPNGAGGRADTGATRPDCTGGERGGCGRQSYKAPGGGAISGG